MSDKEIDALSRWKWIVGTVLFTAMAGVHVFYKEMPLAFFGFPAFLLGLDLSRLFGGKK